MMKSAGRFAAVLLALLQLLASCGGGGKPEPPDSGTHPETTEGIVIAGEGDVLFTVVRPMNANEDEKKGAEAVAAVLGQFAGVTVRVSETIFFTERSRKRTKYLSARQTVGRLPMSWRSFRKTAMR